MKKTICAGLALAATGAIAAMPTVGGVTVSMVQGRAQVNFTLSGGPAFVTVQFLTNGVPLDAALYRDGVTGDAGKLLADGAHKIRWSAHKTMPSVAVKNANFSAELTVWPQSLPPDYMAVDLTSASNVTYYASSNMVPGGVTDSRYKGEFLLMRRMAAAGVRWRMGQPGNEENVALNNVDLLPHWVTLTNDYYIGVFEVTQKQYADVVGSNPSSYQDATDPELGASKTAHASS